MLTRTLCKHCQKGFVTPLSEKLGIKYPLICAPMFIISNKEMVVAAANCGILGSMPSLNARTPEQFESDLQYITERTKGPFAVNITIGLSKGDRLKRDVELCFKYKVPVLITSYGNPTKVVQEAHPRGVTVLHDVINLAHAKKAQAAGVDAIIAVSQGAGGHAGVVNPTVMWPWLVKELSVPVVAAGCIGGGQQVASALALGAQACYMGTKFIASTECGANERYKNLVVTSTHDDVEYTDKVSGIGASFLKQTIPADIQPDRTPEGSAKKWRDIWSAGQGVTLIDEVKPINQIVQDVVAEYHETIARLRAL